MDSNENISKSGICNELKRLIQKLENAEHHKDCYPKRDYPECPPSKAPEPLVIPHPLVPSINVASRPRALQQNTRVTLDGRLAEIYEPREFYFDETPLRLPPWVRPRIPSVELRGGNFYCCQCWKKDGLNDSCNRWDCGGRPECLSKPLPECPPGYDPPIFGVRKGNAMVEPLMPLRYKPEPLPAPFPQPDMIPMAADWWPPTNPPHTPCPIHHQFVPSCGS